MGGFTVVKRFDVEHFFDDFSMKPTPVKLPLLKGSPKQVKWAESIRSSVLEEMDTSVEGAADELYDRLHRLVTTVEAANWWIANRDPTYGVTGLAPIWKEPEPDQLVGRTVSTKANVAWADPDERPHRKSLTPAHVRDIQSHDIEGDVFESAAPMKPKQTVFDGLKMAQQIKADVNRIASKTDIKRIAKEAKDRIANLAASNQAADSNQDVDSGEFEQFARSVAQNPLLAEITIMALMSYRLSGDDAIRLRQRLDDRLATAANDARVAIEKNIDGVRRILDGAP